MAIISTNMAAIFEIVCNEETDLTFRWAMQVP
jgi:hypothetical protein